MTKSRARSSRWGSRGQPGISAQAAWCGKRLSRSLTSTAAGVLLHLSSPCDDAPSLMGLVPECRCSAFSNRKPSYDAEADPSEGLMNVLKKIYEDGDDDMKRTVNKA